MNVLAHACVRISGLRSFVDLVAAKRPRKPAAHFKLADVIRKGRVRIEFLKVQFNKRTEELGARLSAGIAANRDWYFEVVKTNSGPLPYHPNLGLTQEEHAEYLVEAEKRESASFNLPEAGAIGKCALHSLRR